MKSFFLFLVFGGLVALGGAFFGLYQIPGLENLPTVEKLGKSRQGNIEAEAQRRFVGGEEAPPAGPLGARAQGGGLGKRTGMLRASERSLEE